MTESGNGESGKPYRSRGRYFEVVEVSDEDLKRASMIPNDACPRRYCWWWRTLSFDWGLTPAEGCTWPEAEKRPHWHYIDIPCKRSDPASEIDHFEPREPHIEADSIDASGWMESLRLNQEQFP